MFWTVLTMKESPPSVDKIFKKGKYTDYLENFKKDCDDLSESQNGYHQTETMSDGNYKTTFYTSDDTKSEFYGRVTGVVVWNLTVSFEKEIVFDVAPVLLLQVVTQGIVFAFKGGICREVFVYKTVCFYVKFFRVNKGGSVVVIVYFIRKRMCPITLGWFYCNFV